MQIHELPVGSPASGVQFVGDTGSQTQKIDYDALADAILNKLTTKTFDIKSESQTIIAALNALGDASKQDVANNLVTTAAGLVLDARQGKALKDLHDTNANAIASLNSSVARTNISSDVIIPSSESGASCRAYVANRILYISYMSASKTHDSSQLLCTLPSSVTPAQWWDVVCVKNGAGGVVRFATDRSVKLWIDPSSIANAGRIYFDATVPLL